LAGCSEKVDEPEGTGTKIANAVDAGQRSQVKQNTTGPFFKHSLNN
jgi:hypothetical protein